MSDVNNTPKVGLNPSKADQRAAAEDAYLTQEKARAARRATMLGCLEPDVADGIDLGKANFEMSTAISMRRIADALDAILLQMKQQK